MTLTRAERVLLARAAAHTRWAKDDPRAAMAEVRAKAREKLAREVDPDGTLPPAERERRVDALQKAQFARMQAGRARALEAKRRRKVAVMEGGRN